MESMEYYLLEGTFAMNGIINELIKAESHEIALEIAEREYPISQGYVWKLKPAFEKFMPT